MGADPEVAELTSKIRTVVSQATQLSRSLDIAIKDLQTYAPLHARLGQERRRYPTDSRSSGEERRRHG